MKLDPQTTFDIDPTLPPTFYYVLCIILSAHTIYIMTTTPPRFPTLYWNYVSYYENGQRTHPSPPTHVNSHSVCIGIMYYVMNEIICSHYFCHDNNPTPCPHLVLELCIRLQMKSSAHTIFVMTTTLPHAPPCIGIMY